MEVNTLEQLRKVIIEHSNVQIRSDLFDYFVSIITLENKLHDYGTKDDMYNKFISNVPQQLIDISDTVGYSIRKKFDLYFDAEGFQVIDGVVYSAYNVDILNKIRTIYDNVNATLIKKK